MNATARAGDRRLWLGLVFVLVVLVLLVGVFYKPMILATLRPGETVRVEFSRAYKLDVAQSSVKIAGSSVGVVESVGTTGRGTSMVTLKLDRGTRDLLGSAPSALIRPTTILGGRYYVDLRPGGRPGRFTDEVIPLDRAATPVELDEVLSALQPRAIVGLRNTLTEVDQTLRAGGTDALHGFTAAAPAPLAALGPVLAAVRGNQPDTDLARLVGSTDRASAVFIARNGQLSDVVGSLDRTTDALARQSGPLAQGIGNLPGALVAIDHAATRVSVTLDKLKATAPLVEPTAEEFDPLMRRMDPVLDGLRPVTDRLPDLMRDARPLVHELIPVSRRGTDVFDDLRGPVLSRVGGPVTRALYTKWKGTGRFAGSGNNGNTLYQEIASMFSNLANSSVEHDQNGSAINFEVGENSSIVDGLPFALDDRAEQLNEIGGPPR